MNYNETVEYLFSRLPMYQRVGKAAYKEGLENTYTLDEYFRHPHKSFKTIHIAGTNGKGSVSHMLASVLQHSGYKTGLYTSPHLTDFRERIRINGIQITEEYVISFVDQHKDFFERIKPSFFEMSVFMAFDYFRKEQVDIAVIEVGLGGRLDSTNIIMPELSVITNIGFDHTDLLGDTLEKIAFEKAGIIKNNTPVVIGEYQAETIPVFLKKAEENNSLFSIASEKFEFLFHTYSVYDTQLIRYRDTEQNKKIVAETDLLGHYQVKNVATVLAAFKELRKKFIKIDKKTISAGLKTVQLTTGLRGRWQICGHNPLIVCDTAHNVEGLREVIAHIQQTPHKQLHLILGFVKDKDVEKILGIMPHEALYYFVTPSVPRGMDSQRVNEIAINKKLASTHFEIIEEAFAKARLNAKANDLIFIGGSNFLVADFLRQY